MSLSDGDAVVYLNFMGGKQDEEAHVYGNSPLLINLGDTVKRGVGSPLDKKTQILNLCNQGLCLSI